MASSKISELTQIANTTADDLLLISHTSDNGSTYNSRHISRQDLQDDLSITHGQVSDFDTGVQENTLDSLTAPAADVDINSKKLTNVADPVNAQDAATKAYVDATATGLDVKDSVRVATTADITLSGTQTIDGIGLAGPGRIDDIGIPESIPQPGNAVTSCGERPVGKTTRDLRYGHRFGVP